MDDNGKSGETRLLLGQMRLGFGGCGPTGLIGRMRLIGVGFEGLRGSIDLGLVTFGVMPFALNAASNASTTFKMRRMSLAAF